MDEAISSHIGGWFRNAATSARIHPIAQPQYEYDCRSRRSRRSPSPPPSPCSRRSSCPTGRRSRCRVPRPRCLASWSTRRSTRCGTRSPSCRRSRAALPREGDVVVVDVVSPSGEARRDMVVELGTGRMVDELEDALTGMSPGETKDVEHGLADGSTARLTVTLNEIKEKVLPPRDDDLARAASEFDTLAELRADIEERLREQISAEIESGFRAATADTLVQASGVQPSGPLVDARANELLSRLPAHAREPRHLPGDLSHGLRPDPRAAARPAARRGRALRRARARARRSGGAARHRGVGRGDRSRHCESRARPTRRWPR